MLQTGKNDDCSSFLSLFLKFGIIVINIISLLVKHFQQPLSPN